METQGNALTPKRTNLINSVGDSKIGTPQHLFKHRLIKGGLVNYCPICKFELHALLNCSKCGHSVETIGENE